MSQAQYPAAGDQPGQAMYPGINFKPCHRKYSQSEYSKAHVYLRAFHPITFPSCTAHVTLMVLATVFSTTTQQNNFLCKDGI